MNAKKLLILTLSLFLFSATFGQVETKSKIGVAAEKEVQPISNKRVVSPRVKQNSLIKRISPAEEGFIEVYDVIVANQFKVKEIKLAGGSDAEMDVIETKILELKKMLVLEVENTNPDDLDPEQRAIYESYVKDISSIK